MGEAQDIMNDIAGAAVVAVLLSLCADASIFGARWRNSLNAKILEIPIFMVDWAHLCKILVA
jgi:hypothetical protein